jgi:alpha-tubulin suppressor-like RCC1 family protein
MATSQGGYVDGGFDLLKAPDAPTITSVTTSIGSVSVAFTAPANPGGSAVTGYTVTAINESTGASVGATGSGSPISVSTGGGTFRVRAAATNIYGPGRVSAFNTGNVVFSGAELEAWGSNDKGELGDNTVVNKSSPVQIGALTTWASVTASNDFSLSIKTDNTLWAWGYNEFGQLGLNISGLAYSRSSPIQVGALTNWATVSSANNHCIATKLDGTLWTWGRNNIGQLGDGTVVNKSSPVQIGALTTWSHVSGGNVFSAAIKTDGTLWTWGFNAAGQLGQNNVINRSSPVQVGALTDWAKVSTAASACFGVKTNGTLWSWGNNSNGVLGLNIAAASYRSSPVQVGALTNWSSVSAWSHALAVKTDGTLWAWGYNNSGRVGDNTTANRSSPVQVGALTTWSNVSASGNVSVALKTDKTLWAWGQNSTGSIGDGTTVSKSSPVQVGSATNWYAADAGADHTLALYGVT